MASIATVVCLYESKKRNPVDAPAQKTSIFNTKKNNMQKQKHGKQTAVLRTKTVFSILAIIFASKFQKTGLALRNVEN